MLLEISDEQFQEFIDQAFDRLPKKHREHIKNVAILFADVPSELQRAKAKLTPYQTLFGLYEGVPLPARQGQTNMWPPDVITIFKLPTLANVNTIDELREHIYHTLWHEVAHYYGLNHTDIHEREQ